MASLKTRQRWGKIGNHILLLPFLVFAVFPFYHMALTSLKTDRELYDRQAVPLLIRQSAWMRVAPSTSAHSSTSFGTVRK